MRTRNVKIAAMAAAATLALSACGGEGNSGADDGDTLTVGIKYDQPGLGVKDGSDFVGMDVDVAKAVAAEMGIDEGDIEFKETPSAQRENMLDTGQVDMIFATYSITDERKEKVQFAGPYFVAGQDLLVASDSDIAGPEDLEGKLLCSVTGSTSAQNVKDDYSGVQLQEYGTYSECMEAISSGTLDAMTTDDTILAGFAAQDAYQGKFKVVGNTFSEENYGVGLPKDAENCEEINEIVKGLWDDGTMDEIIEEHLGKADYTPNADLNPPEIVRRSARRSRALRLTIS